MVSVDRSSISNFFSHQIVTSPSMVTSARRRIWNLSHTRLSVMTVWPPRYLTLPTLSPSSITGISTSGISAGVSMFPWRPVISPRL